MSDTDIRLFMRDQARRVRDLERKTKSTAAAPADLRHSAIDGGQQIIRSKNGVVTYRIGEDPVTGITEPEFLNGADPEKPEAPHVDVGGETVKVQLSGLDAEGEAAPRDFWRAEVHLSTQEDFTPDSGTFGTYIGDIKGSSTHRIPGGEWWVRIIWVTKSNKRSEPSDAVAVDVPPLVDTDDIEEVLDEAQQRIDDYRDNVAGPRFEQLETKQGEHEIAISDASSAITDAQQALEDKADKSALGELEDKLDNFEFPDDFPDLGDVEAAIEAAESNAKDHADGLPKVLHGTGAPSGTAPDESIWFQHEDDLSGAVIGQWSMVDGSWKSTPVGSEAIANLDVGKLTAGSAVIAEAVLSKIWAELGVFDRLEANKADLIEIVAEDLIAENATLINTVMQNLSVAERADFAEAFADEFWAKLGVFDKLQSEEAWISSAMLENVEAEKVTVTQELVGRIAQFLEIEAGMIKSNAFEGETFTGGTFEGTKFRTHSEPERGVTFSEHGIEVFDSDHNRTMNVEASTGDVSITGRVSSEIEDRPEAAILGVNHRVNRPALILDTGDDADLQPSILSTGSHVNTIPAGSLAMNAREQDANSSGAAVVMLHEGGDLDVKANFGPNGGTGMAVVNGELILAGYTPDNAIRANQKLRAGQTTSTTLNDASIAFDIMLSAPVPYGSHIVTANSYSAMSTGHRAGAVGVTTVNASRLRLILSSRYPSGAGTWSVMYTTHWVAPIGSGGK